MEAEKKEVSPQTKAVLNRIARATGHLESVRRMVEDGKDTAQVLMQLAAVRSALAGIARLMIRSNMEQWAKDTPGGEEMETLSKLNDAIDMLMR